MSEPPTQSPMPLFFKRIVGVNPATHPDLKLDRHTGFAYAAGAQAIPLGVSANPLPAAGQADERAVPHQLLRPQAPAR